MGVHVVNVLSKGTLLEFVNPSANTQRDLVVSARFGKPVLVSVGSRFFERRRCAPKVPSYWVQVPAKIVLALIGVIGSTIFSKWLITQCKG
jgi:hypothetical protein